MPKQTGLYPDYDVLALQDEWDELTRKVVTQRLGPFTYKVLSKWEEAMVKAIAAQLTDDEREEILAWAASHIDQELGQTIGEGHREPDVPPQRELVLQGLKALEKWAKEEFNKPFLDLEAEGQLALLKSLQVGQLPLQDKWTKKLQKALFNKLAGLAIDAYYSHPWVWSEIGYGGPAYPRGYVRIELGLADPWEPKLVTKDEGKEGQHNEA